MTHQISSGLTSHDFVGEECVLSVVMTNILTKHNLGGGKGLFQLTDYSSPSRAISIGTQARTRRQARSLFYTALPLTPELTSQPNEVWKKPWRWRLLAAWLTGWHMLGHLSSTAEDHLLRDGATHSGLGPPTSINHQDNPPQTCCQANLT